MLIAAIAAAHLDLFGCVRCVRVFVARGGIRVVKDGRGIRNRWEGALIVTRC